MNEPRTLTEAIDRCRFALQALDWTDLVLGRAQPQKQQTEGQDRPTLLPMIYRDDREYIDGRPNDVHTSVLFFVATGPEKNDYNQEAPTRHTRSHIRRTRRPVALIGWLNLDKLKGFDDGSGFAERIKIDLKDCLQQVGCVAQINDYLDSPLDDVYRPFQVADLDAQFDKMPYCVFRLDLLLHCVERRQPPASIPVVEAPAPAPEPPPVISAD